ncbi:neurogenic locus notch homolog protein 2-like isoform X5 [Hyperolius riggenbachi]|uniref:neurogenic locus notch homolog protein 2-like isoform X5 n=1 Tax=Hyperolius riggenbachi TaxID=752182 RepID=UPI0035A32D55
MGPPKHSIHNNLYGAPKPAKDNYSVREDKPGMCPKPSGPCVYNIRANCLSDQDCDGAKKCCHNPCNVECKDPIRIKPGRCPKPLDDCVYNIRAECLSDRDCYGTKKCCDNPCNKECKEPIMEKPGRCPKRLVHCDHELPGFCDSDKDCDGIQKCCDTGCNRKCKEPNREKLGICPLLSGGEFFCGDNKSVNCISDYECPGEDKCCNTGCEISCARSYHIPGISSGENPSDGGDNNDECTNDKLCPRGQMCCPTSSGRRCQTPEPVLSLCPPEEFAYPWDAIPCSFRQQCMDGMICCSTSIGSRCLPPTGERWKCPSQSTGDDGPKEPKMESCTNSQDCPSNKNCCDTCEGRRCVTRETGTIHVCLLYNALLCKPGIQKEDQCSENHPCENNGKCCNTCTGRKCSIPMTVDTTICPPYDFLKCEEREARSRQRPCRNNNDCEFYQICAYRRCIIPIVPPRTSPSEPTIKPLDEKPGVCKQEPICFIPPKQDGVCTKDCHCPGEKKCCVTNCEYACVDPWDGGAPEMVPVCPRFDHNTCPSNTTKPHKCQSDSDCDTHKKCCCSNCGLKCVTPDKVKPGRCPKNPPENLGARARKCRKDEECPEDEKCCRSLGNRCYKPEPELRVKCREDLSQNVTCASVTCTRHDDCPLDAKCCSIPNGKACLTLD